MLTQRRNHRGFVRTGVVLLALGALCASAPAEVTPADVAMVKAKLNDAVPFFDRIWTQVFAQGGRQFAPPKIFPFTGSINSACGQMGSGNGMYCPGDNNIYLDAAYLAGLMKEAARWLKTDGDYAAIVVAAHELGHAVQRQLGTTGKSSFQEEQAADCFAGAVTREAKMAGVLDPGDLEEARWATSVVGDMNGLGTLNRMMSQIGADAHGAPDDRVTSFNKGFYAGAQSCSVALGQATLHPGGRILFQDDFARAVPKTSPACSVEPGRGELIVTNIARVEEPCRWKVAGFSPLPDHFRIDVTLRTLRGASQREAGMVFGPHALTALDFAALVESGGIWILYEVFGGAAGTKALTGSAFGHPAPELSLGLNAANRLTLDVHRTQAGATCLFYLNGKFVGVARGSSYQGTNGQIELWVDAPGMSVAFSNFRVQAIPE